MALTRPTVLASLGVALVLYTGAFLSVSLASTERVLPAGTVMPFCGFYLDCHLRAAVAGVETTDLGEGGVRYTVRVRFDSDAVRATLRLERPRVLLVDDAGARIAPEADPPGLALTPDQAATVDLVFEAPRRLENPRLRVTKGRVLERLSELFLIGDPDSWLHAPVSLALR